jgi:hypothetical protein
MFSPGKGGRGKQAPYSTTHCRVPEPIKESIERFAAAYRILSFDGDSEGCRNLIKSVDDATASLGEAEEEIKRLKLELSLAKTKIEVLENEREFAITNLLTAYDDFGSRDGVKLKEAIAIAIPEVKERYELFASPKRKSKK